MLTPNMKSWISKLTLLLVLASLMTGCAGLQPFLAGFAAGYQGTTPAPDTTQAQKPSHQPAVQPTERPAPQPVPWQPYTTTVGYQSEAVTGTTKQCLYALGSETYVRTVKAIDSCPLTIQVSR